MPSEGLVRSAQAIGYRREYATRVNNKVNNFTRYGACFLSRLKARTIISKFQCFNILKCACPAVIKSERLGKGLADDVACFVWVEELRVKWDNLSRKGGALGFELWVEGFKVKEDCLLGLCYFFYALAGDGDENIMFSFHIRYYF